MLLKLNALGGDSVTNSAIPPKKSYSKIKILGESYVDELHVQDKEISNTDIVNTTVQVSWGTDTILLAHFDNNLEAGNYTNSNLPITSWRIVRRKFGNLLYDTLAEIANDGTTSYVDFKPSSNVNYEYGIQAISDGTTGNIIVGEMSMSFFGWKIHSQDNLTSFSFDMEIDTDSIQVNTDRHQFNTYSQYPTISRGKQKFLSGRITAMPYEVINNDIEVTNNVLESLKEFIENGQPKILKNGSGQTMLCDCFNFNYKYRDKLENNGQQPYTISFDFVQIGEAV
jgi:hypothetical protein